MSCGTPVICSNAASLPEVGGDAAVYFDPKQIDELANVLYNVLQNNELRKKMSENGMKQVAKFSWERTAEQTLAVYDRVLA
jgi:glycosyltransferase involved in cell wall biosynthesis